MASDLKIPKNCNMDKAFEVKLFYLLAKNEKKDTLWNKYLTDCKDVIDLDFNIITTLNASILENKKSLDNHLLLLGVSKKQRKRIIKIYNKKHTKSEDLELLKLFFKMVDSFDKPQSNAIIHASINRWNKVLTKSKSYFLQKMANALFAIKLRNRAKLKRNVEAIISISPMQIAAEFEAEMFKDEKTYELFVLKIMKALDLINESLGDEKLGQILLAHLSYTITDKAYHDFANSRGANWDLTSIRKILNSYSYGRRFPGAWLWRLQGGAIIKSADSFLKESLVYDNVSNLSNYDLWVLKYFYPPNAKLRKKLIRRIFNNWKSSSYNLQQVVIDLIHIPVIKKELAKKRRLFKKPIFSIERTFYWEKLNNGTIIDRAVFDLIRLGERDNDLLWWLVL